MVRADGPLVCRGWIAVLCAVLVAPGNTVLYAQQSAPPASTSGQAGAPAQAKLPPEQLDSLVAPIALYPDPMLSQVLVASTYPLEIVQLQQWLEQNKGLKDKALADAAMKQDWDPSIQAMAAMPDLVKRLSENIKWTADLGNAFLAQQSDVMDAVQRMRKKAQDAGNLKTTEQQKVENEVVQGKSVVVIEQADPQVVYVPSYNPTVVYGAPAYPYPPMYYPPPGYYAAGMAISFGVGMAMGAAWGGGWGWGSSWGNNDIDVDIDNNFNRNANRNVDRSRTGTAAGRGGNTWQHNPRHRGGAPYSDRATANRFGGTARGDTFAARQNTARTNQAQFGRGQQGGTMDRGGAGARAQSGIGSADRAGSANRAGSAWSGGDRVGNREVPSFSSSSNRSAFGGADSGMGRSGARASSARGGSSMRSMSGGGFGGGGMSRGGGFGGGRGGGRGGRR